MRSMWIEHMTFRCEAEVWLQSDALPTELCPHLMSKGCAIGLYETSKTSTAIPNPPSTMHALCTARIGSTWAGAQYRVNTTGATCNTMRTLKQLRKRFHLGVSPGFLAKSRRNGRCLSSMYLPQENRGVLQTDSVRVM
jgi:hypothetical protein